MADPIIPICEGKSEWYQKEANNFLPNGRGSEWEL